MRKRANLPALIAALIALAIGAVWQHRNRGDEAIAPPAEGRVAAPAPAAEPPARERVAPPAAADGPAAIRDREERQAVQQTLALIARGGPFPFAKDGAVFSNRERLLPQQPRGYYREYTVPTPSESDRGARRIVRGSKGETYYTADHYRSFIRLDE